MTPNTHLRLVSPTKEKRTVMPRRCSNGELRPREHLTEREIEKLIAARSRATGMDSVTPPCCRLAVCKS
jgi:hypothetical protein